MNFFEVQVVYTRQIGDLIKESYLVESINPSSAENKVLKEIKPYISGECEVLRIIQRKFFDYILNSDGEYWYKVRIDIITIDENNGREGRKTVTVYVQASSVKQAIEALQTYLKQIDCEIISITKTSIVELYR